MNTNNNNISPNFNSRQRANGVHSKLRGLALKWIKRHRPEVVEKLRKEAKRLVKLS